MKRATWGRFLVGRRPSRTLIRLGVLVAASALVFGGWLLPVRTHDPSMLPAHQPGSLKFVNTLAYTWRSPDRRDIVAIRLAGRGVLYIKRVVGLPGERIEIVGGIIYVDSVALNEPYVTNRHAWTVPSVTLEVNEYYVVGDNRGMPPDQHLFGTVARSRIVGRILF